VEAQHLGAEGVQVRQGVDLRGRRGGVGRARRRERARSDGRVQFGAQARLNRGLLGEG